MFRCVVRNKIVDNAAFSQAKKRHLSGGLFSADLLRSQNQKQFRRFDFMERICQEKRGAAFSNQPYRDLNLYLNYLICD